MPTESAKSRVEQIDVGSLPQLHRLAAHAFCFDRFSPSLLAEKLFRNPRPAEFEYSVFAAIVDGALAGMIQSVVRAGQSKAWLGLLAVEASHRRRGIARTMLEHVMRLWRNVNVQNVEVMAIPGNYFTPGVDPRYTEGLCFLERAGFERFRDCVNLTADLTAPFETGAEERRLANDGVVVRRAATEDGPLLDAFFADHFGADWRLEAQLAMDNDPPALHVAIRRDRLIAFSAYSTQNREWGFFGPMGTAPEARGLGIGKVLLHRCLNDLREAGHETAVIPWVGPIPFYSHHANCRVERVFWRYRLTLAKA